MAVDETERLEARLAIVIAVIWACGVHTCKQETGIGKIEATRCKCLHPLGFIEFNSNAAKIGAKSQNVNTF